MKFQFLQILLIRYIVSHGTNILFGRVWCMKHPSRWAGSSEVLKKTMIVISKVDK